MTSLATRLRARFGATAWWVGVGALPVAGVLVARMIDARTASTVLDAVRASPGSVVAVLAIYATAFLLRALAWSRTLRGLPFGHALAAIHASLGANHVLPLRLGEVLRVASVVRRTSVDPAAAVTTTVTLRAADVLAVGVQAAVLGPGLALDVLGPWGPVLLALAVGGVVLGGRWSGRLGSGAGATRSLGPGTWTLVTASWVLEGAVVHQAAAWAGVEISVAEAVLVTAVTIAAQVAAVTPGGFGTYEAAATAVLAAVGVPPAVGLTIAVTAHAVKTLYALAAGALAVVTPQPSLFGRLRLAASPLATPSGDRPAVPDLGGQPSAPPVVLFLPAHDEEAAVAAVVRRVPAQVAGHPVRCLVIDDGSTDGTAHLAKAAGAEVVALGRNVGLGAAVRRGLAEGVARDAVAVAFCDADGEYAPEELPRLIEPILAGRADYVVGSRFDGTITHMLPHRRIGNRVLTAALRFVTRAPISDGQSGYRALSHRAAAQAQVIHDFNYAQVLTIDLLARGARYVEVPISYRFRETGRSFVRLGRYLAAVVPAVHRQVNTNVTPLWAPTAASAEPLPTAGGGR